MRRIYNIDKRSEAIKEIQRYLLAISYIDDPPYLSHISIDGIYGDSTRNAVSDFQKRYGLGVTGEVDLQTWLLLYLKYLETEKPV